MALHQGHGGKVSSTPTGDLNIFNWSFDKMRALAETTNSGSAGWRNRLPTVRDSKGTFEMPWDDAATPESKGFDIGASITLKMFLGDSGLAYSAPCLIENLSFKDDNQNDLVRLVVTWSGNGAVTGPA